MVHIHRHGSGHGHGHRHGDGHDHGDHGHDHAHGGAGQMHADLHYQSGVRASRSPLVRALILTFVIAVAEVIGGVITNSLALIADAGHMVTDVAALGLALFAGWLSRRPALPGHTFGPRRWEVLAAWLNGAALVVISAGIMYEAIGRLHAPPAVEGKLMLTVAVIGLVSNGFSAWWLHGASKSSINVRGAYLHVLGDLGGSLATILAAIALIEWNWTIADPIASIAVSLLVLVGAWRLMREATDVLLEATPPHIDLDRVRGELEDVKGVDSVHDLHVWTVGSGVVAMSAHAVLADPSGGQVVLEESRRAMEDLGIAHVTIQVEGPALEGCGDCTTGGEGERATERRSASVTAK